MHRSRIGVVLIDHPRDRFESSAAFWALARGSTRRADGDEPVYDSLDPIGGGIMLELQRTGEGTPARVHLDIETDDVDAEIARLVAAGATVVERQAAYAVLRDPGGLVFCVVPVQTGRDFDAHATTWN
ncbi:VOC family protein [Nocardioides jensenii]|uniref:VOC family protein n=1 Tax=Nocardioides jensenii TaxID=1843 RepID=UPI000834DC4A|nr:VOC family protein [Nocardioides jensenii]